MEKTVGALRLAALGAQQTALAWPHQRPGARESMFNAV